LIANQPEGWRLHMKMIVVYNYYEEAPRYIIILFEYDPRPRRRYPWSGNNITLLEEYIN